MERLTSPYEVVNSEIISDLKAENNELRMENRQLREWCVRLQNKQSTDFPESELNYDVSGLSLANELDGNSTCSTEVDEDEESKSDDLRFLQSLINVAAPESKNGSHDVDESINSDGESRVLVSCIANEQTAPLVQNSDHLDGFLMGYYVRIGGNREQVRADNGITIKKETSSSIVASISNTIADAQRDKSQDNEKIIIHNEAITDHSHQTTDSITSPSSGLTSDQCNTCPVMYYENEEESREGASANAGVEIEDSNHDRENLVNLQQQNLLNLEANGHQSSIGKSPDVFGRADRGQKNQTPNKENRKQQSRKLVPDANAGAEKINSNHERGNPDNRQENNWSSPRAVKYECKWPGCGKRFRLRIALNQHKQNCQNRIKLRKRQSVVENAFSSQSEEQHDLRRITRNAVGATGAMPGTGDGEKRQNTTRYECQYCHKEFTRSCNLQRHTQIHLGPKSYQCDVSGSGKNQFKCPRRGCGTVYNRKSNLNRHRRASKH